MTQRTKDIDTLNTLHHRRVDIFCQVIDNFGDAGICWRLARQLASEYPVAVRLWINVLATLAQIDSRVDADLDQQSVAGVEIRLWPSVFPSAAETGGMAGVIIEAFACRLPDSVEQAMAKHAAPHRPPVWINLEYLSAEPWVDTIHGQPSPHPNLPLTKYFFCPGFSVRSGGLLRESGLLAERQKFVQDREQKEQFWKSIGLPRIRVGEIRISLFCYDPPALTDFLTLWVNGSQVVTCIIPATAATSILPRLTSWLDLSAPLAPGKSARMYAQGSLRLVIVPFLENNDYDRLLWACDFNFVRGEDSFVRAQWAARPLVWNIYPQDDEVHMGKLNAFLDRYGHCSDHCIESEAVINALLKINRLWNSASAFSGLDDLTQLRSAWTTLLKHRQVLDQHAATWTETLAERGDLAGNLLRFCEQKTGAKNHATERRTKNTVD